MSKRWEHTYTRETSQGGDAAIAAHLEAQGRDGWELVAAQVTTMNMRVEHHFWWKRRRTD
jgi:hypothetical protein